MTEQINELSKKTLKSYVKKATKSADKAWEKTDKEEDKAMSTDGEKYPDKQNRHIANARKHNDVWAKRDSGLKMANKKLGEEVEVNENLENILVHAWNKDAVNLRGALDTEMQSRVSDHIEDMIANVSARFFNPSLSTTDENHEG